MSDLANLAAAIAANTAAVERNNELLIEAAAGRERAIAAAEAASTKPASTKKSEPKATEAAKPAEAAKAEPAASDEPTVEDVTNAITRYLAPPERVEERAARKSKVLGVLTKFSPEGTEKPNGATLAADKRAAFIKTVDKWIADGDLTTPPAAASDDDLLGD